MLTVSCRNDASQQEDMSDQEGVVSASNPEATLTHPSARDRRERPSASTLSSTSQDPPGGIRFSIKRELFKSSAPTRRALLVRECSPSPRYLEISEWLISSPNP